MRTRTSFRRALVWGLVSFFAAAVCVGVGSWAAENGMKNLQAICFLLTILSVLSGFLSIAVGWKSLLFPPKPNSAAE
jgi:CHASE2 domain-containing sensor protein